MNTLTPLLLAALTLAAACASAQAGDPPAASENTQATLKLGESATLTTAGTDVAVTFTDVVGDSRCPRGVQCIWMGEVKIALTATTGDAEPTRLELTLGANPSDATAALDGAQLHLLAVDPYPVEGKKIERTQYTATLTLEPSSTNESQLPGRP